MIPTCSATIIVLKLTQTSLEKAMATHSSTLAWKIQWTEEPGRLQSVGSLRVEHDWATSLSLFIFMHWRRKWQPTLAWRIPRTGEPGELLSMGWHYWSDLAAAYIVFYFHFLYWGFGPGTQLKVKYSRVSACTEGRKAHHLLPFKPQSHDISILSSQKLPSVLRPMCNFAAWPCTCS